MFSHYSTDWQVAVRREETPAMCYQKADKKNTASKDNVNNSGFKKDPKIGFDNVLRKEMNSHLLHLQDIQNAFLVRNTENKQGALSLQPWKIHY